MQVAIFSVVRDILERGSMESMPIISQGKCVELSYFSVFKETGTEVHSSINCLSQSKH